MFQSPTFFQKGGGNKGKQHHAEEVVDYFIILTNHAFVYSTGFQPGGHDPKQFL